jgi:type II secretory pathway component PulF
MRMALSCGNSFPEAVGLSADIIGNTEVKRRLEGIRQSIDAGAEIPDAMAKAELFPQSFVNLFTTAYRTGNLDETLARMASYYSESYDDSIYGITSRIEPVLVIILSCVAGVILFSVMMPIINIMQLVG